MNNIPEHLLAQTETRTINRRTRQVIPVAGMTTNAIMVMFNISSRFTARDVRVRGYYVVDYMQRSNAPGILADVDEAYRIAKWWFHKKLAPRGLPWWAEKDDLIQEAVARLVELAGDPRMTKKSFIFNVIKTAMYDYIRKNRKHEHESEEAIDNPGRHRATIYQQSPPDGFQACHASPDTWRRKHAATEAICRIIETKGVTPMEWAA